MMFLFFSKDQAVDQNSNEDQSTAYSYRQTDDQTSLIVFFKNTAENIAGILGSSYYRNEWIDIMLTES